MCTFNNTSNVSMRGGLVPRVSTLPLPLPWNSSPKGLACEKKDSPTQFAPWIFNLCFRARIKYLIINIDNYFYFTVIYDFFFRSLNERFRVRIQDGKVSKQIIIEDLVLVWLWQNKVLHSKEIFLGNLFYDLAFNLSSRNSTHLLCTLSSFRPTVVYSYNTVRLPYSKVIIFVESTRK